jgi:hypothetical protein
MMNMGIKSIKVDELGNVGVLPRLVRIETDDAIATVAAAGYLNDAIDKLKEPLIPGDMCLVHVIDAGLLKPAWLSLSKTAGDWKLDNPITA